MCWPMGFGWQPLKLSPHCNQCGVKPVSQFPFAAMPEWKQRPTRFPALCLGGPQKYKGCFVLGDAAQVSTPEFWSEFSNIRLTINCIGSDKGVQYPSNAAISQVHFVNMRSKDNRHPNFMDSLDKVRNCLGFGNDVLVHCRESFHRAPICLATYMQQICGVPYQVTQR